MTQAFAILLVEDNPAEVLITQRALRESPFQVELFVVRDGQEAVDYLFRQGSHANTPNWRHPDLVLLDLNIPEMNGADLVEMLRSYVRLHSVPVVVFTAAPDGPLAVRAKSLQVSAVLAKGSTSLRDIADTITAVLTEGPQRKTIPLEKWRQDEISPL